MTNSHLCTSLGSANAGFSAMPALVGWEEGTDLTISLSQAGDVPPRVDHLVDVEAAVTLGKRSSGDLLGRVKAVALGMSIEGSDERRHALVAA